MCKASLVFKSKLMLALSIILKEKELCESKNAPPQSIDALKIEICYPFWYVHQS